VEKAIYNGAERSYQIFLDWSGPKESDLDGSHGSP